jgi:pimeloyl-ACP methyl ester carboxylesterase
VNGWSVNRSPITKPSLFHGSGYFIIFQVVHGEYIHDLKTMVEKALAGVDEKLPVLLVGHSMGGLIALSFARQYPAALDGRILSSPSGSGVG